MLLHDIGKSPNTTLRRINQHLEANYGFKISENVNDTELVSIMEQIEGEITDLKVQGADAKTSSEISKRLLILEGIKTLREFADIQFKSPKLDSVVNNLANFVVEIFEITGKDSLDFEKAVERAMDEYRSSRYRFPDDFIEQKVRHEAMNMLESMSDMHQHDALAPGLSIMEDESIDQAQGDSDANGIEEDEDPFKSVGKRASAAGGHAGEVPNTPHARHAMKVLGNDQLSMQDMNIDSNDNIPLVLNPNTGRMVPDPFAAHAAARKQGIAMREHENLVKNLRRLLETEVSQAEVMMAAKGFAQELQEMVEKIGRLQNEDLPPVTDQMRETYGTDSATAFQTQIYSALQGVMDSLYTAKQQVDDAVTNMAATGQVTAQTDMDKDIDMGMDDEMSMGGVDDLDNIAADLDQDTGMDDEFGAEDGEEPLGRAKKMESALQQKVLEMRKLVAKARALREAKVAEEDEIDEKVEIYSRNKYSGDSTFSRTKKNPSSKTY
jgi:hypothetical protein